MKTVFILQHLHVHKNKHEDFKLIGVYQSIEKAKTAIDRLIAQPGFCDFPNLIDPLMDDTVSGFYIDKYRIDEDNWSEGFGV